MTRHVAIVMGLVVLGIYLFVSAPPPLPEAEASNASGSATIPVRILLDSANLVNAAARKIYTERIVTNGQEAGLLFDEDWQSLQLEAGPLPALFLRSVAVELRKQEAPLALFLGSHQPIVPSNAFKGELIAHFEGVQADRKPRYFAIPAPDREVALYADIASAPGCVTCHNTHAKSPKRDWKLNDVMGATTWTYPRPTLSDRELRHGIARVYDAIERTYITYLTKVRLFRDPPPIGGGWPGKGRRVLPDAAAFMTAVREATALPILDAAVLLR